MQMIRMAFGQSLPVRFRKMGLEMSEARLPHCRLVRNGNGPWGGLDSGGGTNFISIQGSGATLQQTLTGLTPGMTYAVTFLATHRPGYGNDETIHVNIDGDPIWESNHPEVRTYLALLSLAPTISR